MTRKVNRIAVSQRERELLACIELDTTKSAQALAKLLGWRVHSVQYLLTKLKGKGLLTRFFFIDIHRLGYRWCGIFFSVQASEHKRKALIAQLSTSDRVGWFAELEGQFRFGLAIAVKSPVEVEEFFGMLLSSTGITIHKKAVTFRLNLIDCPRGYLINRVIKQAPHSMRDGVPLVAIDDLDRQVLFAIASLPELSLREMAASIKMPHTTFDLRLRKLRENGVVLGTAIQMDLRALNRQAYKILVYAKGKDLKLTDELRRFSIYNPIVVHFVECLGSWDYELNIEADSSERASAFVQDVENRFGDRISDLVAIGIAEVHRLCRYPFPEEGLNYFKHCSKIVMKDED